MLRGNTRITFGAILFFWIRNEYLGIYKKGKRHTNCVPQVEMAGIEPASERFVPRTSTSVVVCELSLDGLQTTKDSIQPSARARKPLFHTLSGICVWHSSFCVARPIPGQRAVMGGRGPSRGLMRSLALH